GGAVVERQRVERDGGRRIEQANVLERPVEDRQCGEAKEVELHQPDGLHIVLVELGQDRVRARLDVQRTEIGQLARRDQHAAGAHADIARQYFQLLREVEPAGS